MASTTQTKRARTQIPTEIRAFCKRLGITRYLPIALRLLRESFPRLRDLKMYPECDPESGEEWFVLQFRVPGTYEEVERRYDEFSRKLLHSIPLEHFSSIRAVHIRT